MEVVVAVAFVAGSPAPSSGIAPAGVAGVRPHEVWNGDRRRYRSSGTAASREGSKHILTGGGKTGEMKRHIGARITEGEINGAPVPGGWPNRGPFRVVGEALARLFGRRDSRDAEDVTDPPDDARSEPEK